MSPNYTSPHFLLSLSLSLFTLLPPTTLLPHPFSFISQPDFSIHCVHIPNYITYHVCTWLPSIPVLHSGLFFIHVEETPTLYLRQNRDFQRVIHINFIYSHFQFRKSLMTNWVLLTKPPSPRSCLSHPLNQPTYPHYLQYFPKQWAWLIPISKLSLGCPSCSRYDYAFSILVKRTLNTSMFTYLSYVPSSFCLP